jgi:predicted dehydrogenase
VAAGKHVLAQKPLTSRADELRRLPALLALTAERGVRIAVNHNGRWAPPWRRTTLLARSGRIGEVVGVTHLHDKPLPPLAGTPFDALPHMLLADYLVHWLDITRCWLEPAQVTTVTASDSRVPGQAGAGAEPVVGDRVAAVRHRGDGARAGRRGTRGRPGRPARSGSTARRARCAAAS